MCNVKKEFQERPGPGTRPVNATGTLLCSTLCASVSVFSLFWAHFTFICRELTSSFSFEISWACLVHWDSCKVKIVQVWKKAALRLLCKHQISTRYKELPRIRVCSLWYNWSEPERAPHWQVSLCGHSVYMTVAGRKRRLFHFLIGLI